MVVQIYNQSNSTPKGINDLKGRGLLYKPKTLSLHLTDLCNSACIFCGEDSHNHQQDQVLTHDLMEFLKKYRNNEWTAVNIHGGEPTIRKDFFQIIQYIRTVFETIILQTNALKMADRDFALRVHKIGVDIFTVGFHGHNQKLMEVITQSSGSFEKAVKGIRNIRSSKSILRITIVVCKQNYRFLPDICRFLINEGVDHLNISAMQPEGSASFHLNDLFISYQEAHSYIKEAIELGLQAGCTVTLEGFPYCAVPEFEIYQVDWSQHTLKVLYRDMVIDDFNQFLNLTVRSKGDKCKRCKLSQYCGGVYTEYIQHYGWEEFNNY